MELRKGRNGEGKEGGEGGRERDRETQRDTEEICIPRAESRCVQQKLTRQCEATILQGKNK